jgi:hypothetical protein
MYRKYSKLTLIIVLFVFSFNNLILAHQPDGDGYGIQWMKNYGPDHSGGRYEGPQPIGDCDNDGWNELLIGGRDATLAVMKWDGEKQVYIETAALHCPFYPLFLIRQLLTGETPPNPGGFAIGDVTGDGENEIVATWYATVYKYLDDAYRIIGLNSWIFRNDGANGDCYIGDCDNDGLNEVIMSGGGGTRENPVPEIVVLKWNGWRLSKVAVYDDPAFGYAYMAGIGDPDGDGENEIAVGISNWRVGPVDYHKVVVLDWNKETQSFDPTVIYETRERGEAPFGGWCADSDMDGIDEIHVGYGIPKIMIFEWDDTGYIVKYDKEWSGEGPLIESLNIGDVDNDGFSEVCAGTDIIHILQWNGINYTEEAIINQTYGALAVLNIGDCDNDGKNEINVAPVFVEQGMDYIEWVFKYGWKS